MRKVQEFVYPWDAGSLLVMHSDGLGTPLEARSRIPASSGRIPRSIAAMLYRDHARRRDDVERRGLPAIGDEAA